MRECEPVRSITIVASSTIENPVGLPILTGPVTKSTARARRWTPSCRRGKCGDLHVYRTVPERTHPAQLTVSHNGVADLGRDPFADNDGCDDSQQNERHLRPGEHGDRGVERQADTAGAN